MFIVAPASFAQARIWLDEQTRFQSEQPQVAIYNMPFLYHLSSKNALSVTQLQYALQLIINKHQSLRTSLIFDTENNILMQRIINFTDNNHKLFSFIESTFKTDEQLNKIMYNEKCNSQLFDLTQGLVFRCHIVYYNDISSNNLVCDKDIIIFNSLLLMER